jgi:hypothetical protein
MIVAKESSRTSQTVRGISILAMLCGAAGMPASFQFLSSMHTLDVMAGAAGFVAGAMLISAGLLSLAWIASADRTPAAPNES